MTKNSAKLVKSLYLKKFRKETGLFLVEGEKSIVELAHSDFEVVYLYVTEEIQNKHYKILSKYSEVTELATQEELTKAGTLEFNDTGIAVVKQKENVPFEIGDRELIVALDELRDPGNLGTIIRTCDWYGVKKIICSETTAEFYNPKVIASSMGSFTRTQIFYTDLKTFFAENKNVPVLGTLLLGQDAHTFAYPQSGILLMGSESNGINKELIKSITNKITIPAYGKAESLNVSMATGIVLDNWRRSLK